MNTKTKSFWIYTIILFTVALVLVLLSFAMTDYRQANKNYESRVQTLQTENAALNEAKTKNAVTIAGLEEKNRQLSEELDKYRLGEEAYADAVEAIYEADGFCESGDWRDAKRVLDKVDPTILKPRIHSRYIHVKSKITRNLD